MREIKFKAWNKKDKFMYEPFDIETEGYVEFDFSGGVELMQYIGLKDKNSVEIFEGDIVSAKTITDQNTMNEYEYSFGVIKFGFYELELNEYSEEVYGYYIDGYDEYKRRSGKLDRYSYLRPTNYVDHWEVIGNIYEDKELLGEDK